MKDFIAFTLMIIVVSLLLNQCRKPRGWPGRFFLWVWNINHSAVTDWGLKHVSIEKHYTVLDVGCGGGRTIHKLAAVVTEGKVCGVDYSRSSVAASRSMNREYIKTGLVEIRHGSVTNLTFPNSMFDLVTAVETHYYWPDLVANMREVLRVLKPGGSLIIIAEAYKGRKFDMLYRMNMKLIRANYLSVNEHSELFSKAGYSEIEMFEEYRKGWICGIARKPSMSFIELPLVTTP